MNGKTTLALIVCVAIHLPNFTQDDDNGLIQKLRSKDKEECDKALSDLKEHRKSIIRELIKIVSQDEINCCSDIEATRSKMNAIEALGNYRAEEAAEVLLNNLLYGTGSTLSSKLPDPPPPSISALINIGMPAVTAMINKLNITSMEDSITLVTPERIKDKGKSSRYLIPIYYGEILRGVLGDSGPSFIKKAIDRARHDQKKQVLLSNLKRLAEIWKDELPEEYWKEK